MPNQPPLNPDALANLRLLADEGTRELRHVVLEPDLLHKLLDVAETVAQPVVNSVPGVYDIGSPEPEGVDYVVECDEHGVATDYLCSDAFSGYWSKTTDGTQWKGYQDGKVYMSWAELVRRVGPVKEVDDD